jgi:hypothetical protein
MAGVVKQRYTTETLLKGRDKETELTEERTKYLKSISCIFLSFSTNHVLNLNNKWKVNIDRVLPGGATVKTSEIRK